MKKFYYKKEDSVDKTPIVLECRNTAGRDGSQEEVENRLSARTSSLGSVDQLSSASLLPRIRGKEQITKSLSEDVLVRSYMKNPGKVITERELSASRLYKTRKASMNSKSSPRKAPLKGDLSSVNPKDPKFKPVHVPHKDCPRTGPCVFPQPATQKNDLSPVTLKDPKFKPVPVEPKHRRKGQSSCLCYFGIFMAISLCTIGFLAGVTGLLYSEIFSDKNSTYRLQEPVIDLSNFVKNNSSIHEYRVLNNDTFARKVSSESVDYDSGEIRRSGSNLIESEVVDSVQFRQMDMTDLNRLIDNKLAEVKFQDRDTTIFEVNTGSSAEQKNSIDNQEAIKEEINSAEIVMTSETDVHNNPNTEHVPIVVPSIIQNEKPKETESPPIFDGVEQRENDSAISNIEENRDPTSDTEQTFDLHANDLRQEMAVPKFDSETKTNGSSILNVKQEIENINVIKNKNMDSDSRNVIREGFKVFDKKTEVEEKVKNIDVSSNIQFHALENSPDINHDKDLLNLSDKKSSDGPEDHSASPVLESKVEKESVASMEDNTVISLDKNISKPSVKLNRINVEFKTVTASLPKEKVVWKAGDPVNVSNVDGEESGLADKEISSEDIDANANSEVEHDVEAILEIIDEPVDDVQDPFDVNRNGDIINVSSETFNLGLKPDSDIFKVKSEDGNSLLRTESQSPQKDQTPKETLRIKPSNMKVSLAEAMKHLQTLDVNNKLLTTRMKSFKPKAQREKPTTSGDKQMKPFQTLDIDSELLKSRMKSIQPKAQKEKPSKLSDKEIKKESLSMDRMQLLRNLRLALQGNLIGL